MVTLQIQIVDYIFQQTGINANSFGLGLNVLLVILEQVVMM
jgi:hypothetical protein